MRFKGVLASFILVLSVIFLTMIFFIQTESFGNLVTKIINDLTRKNQNVFVSIKKIEFSIYPLGLEFKKVEVRRRTLDLDIVAELGAAGIYLNLLEIEDQRISFGELKLRDGYLKINFQKSDEPIKEVSEDIIEEVFKYPEALPLSIDTINLENVMLDLNDDSFEVKRLKVFKENNKIRTRIHLSNLYFNNLILMPLDEVISEIDISRKNINIHRMKFVSEINELTLSGKIENYRKLMDSTVEVTGTTNIYLKTIASKYFQSFLKFKDGVLKSSFDLKIKSKEFSGKSNVSLIHVRSNILDAEKIELKLSLERDKIYLSEFNLSNKLDALKIKNSFQIYNIKTKKLFADAISFKFENYDIKNGLKFLGDSLNLIEGRISGNGNIEYRNHDFLLNLQNGFIVNNFRLSNSNGDFEILKIKNAVLNQARFVFKDELEIHANIKLPQSDFIVSGTLNKKKSNLKVEKGFLDFSDLGNLAQLGLAGHGYFNFQVTSAVSSPTLSIQGDFDEFELLKYQLGKSKIDVDINLADSKVKINDVDSRFGLTPISGSGIVNYKTKDIYIGLNSKNSKSNDLRKILSPIFNKIKFFPNDFSYDADLDVYIFGKYTLEDLRIKADANFKNVLFLGEKLDKGSFSFEMKEKQLSFSNLSFSKGVAAIDGFFKYNLQNDIIDLRIVWDNFWLSKFNFIKEYGLNIDGLSVGKIIGKGQVKDYLITIDGILTSAKSSSFFLKDSNFSIRMTPKKMQGHLDLFGGQADINFNHPLNKSDRSRVDLKVNIPNLAPVFSILSPKVLSEENPSGRLKFDSFLEKGGKFSEFSFLLNINELMLDAEKFKFNFISDKPVVRITNGHVDFWRFNFQNDDISISSIATGFLGNNFKTINHVNFNAKILDLFSSRVLSGEGKINNKIIVESNVDNFDFYASSSSDGLNLSLDKSPLPFNDVKYFIEFINNKLLIKKLIAKLDSGNFQVLGDILFNKNHPDINLKYVLDKAEIPLLDKSSVIVSGEGIVLGTEPPYVVSGDLDISKFNIMNELVDFQKKSVTQIKYLPRTEETALEKNLKLNLRTKFSNPIRISNSMMDFNLSGELSLTGNPRRPLAEGRLFSAANISRVFFKNNEYLINNADFNFSSKKDISNPDFDIQATTVISNTKIIGKVYGDLERFNFDLTSDPPMPRNSILSLIAFGYTDELQNSLTQDEQQNLTQMGVGSFVFDRFKISDILKKQFGLQVNLGTVFEQSQTQSMLSGRNQDNNQKYESHI